MHCDGVCDHGTSHLHWILPRIFTCSAGQHPGHTAIIMAGTSSLFHQFRGTIRITPAIGCLTGAFLCST